MQVDATNALLWQGHDGRGCCEAWSRSLLNRQAREGWCGRQWGCQDSLCLGAVWSGGEGARLTWGLLTLGKMVLATISYGS